MTSDIVQRLRDARGCKCDARCEGDCVCDLLFPGTAAKAADEIERLREEIRRLQQPRVQL